MAISFIFFRLTCCSAPKFILFFSAKKQLTWTQTRLLTNAFGYCDLFWNKCFKIILALDLGGVPQHFTVAGSHYLAASLLHPSIFEQDSHRQQKAKISRALSVKDWK
ncbi:hypothetical protein SELMODRAFT_429698 [Selaginella moellendorffii]|uniref:Transposase putative helix-turn-helix domain-containing protein n=1 Tax=Selaginella moellendorffii TaxID=88036 RepID=D8T705_SELML|nr:hypothetical protein SELMODRAFT_429698 [Selaginella moellendorffii]